MPKPRGASLDPLRFPQRKAVRLEHHTYSAGAYFITICVHGRRPLLSTIVEGDVLLSPVGNILVQEWLRTPELRPGVLIDAFVVMPNHFHGVVMLDPVPIPQSEPPAGSRAHAVRPYQSGTRTGPESLAWSRPHAVRPYESGMRTGPESPAGSRAHAVRPYESRLGRFVAGFKSACTRRYRETTGNAAGPLWQRGFYEHVIRGLPELDRIRRYIGDNPHRWKPPFHQLRSGH